MTPFAAQDADFESRVRESFSRLTLMQTIGARLLRVAPGEVEIELPFRDDFTQHHGFLAAAVLTAIVDVACGYAAMSLMPAGASVLTIEYKVNFVSPARGERMIARGRVVRPGRTMTTCAGDVFAVISGEERLVATMLATMMQVVGERDAPTRYGDEAVHRPFREHGGRRRQWCVCGGRGLGRRLRDAVGMRR